MVGGRVGFLVALLKSDFPTSYVFVCCRSMSLHIIAATLAFRKDWRMVYGLFDVKRRGRQKVHMFCRQKIRSFGEEGRRSQGGQGLPSRRESGMVEGWDTGMDVEEIQSRKKLDEQNRKLQKELRDIEKFSCLSKEVQESLKCNLQQQLQEVEQGRHDSCQRQKVNKKHKRCKAFRVKEEI